MDRPPHSTEPPPRRFRYSLRTLFLLVTVAALLLACTPCATSLWTGRIVIARYRCPQGQIVEISQPTFWENQSLVSVQIRYHDTVLVGDILCGDPYPDRVSAREFRLISCRNGDIVAVFSTFDALGRSGPWHPLFVHQFSTGISSSPGEDDYTPPDLLAEMVTIFKEEYPHLPVSLEPRKWDLLVPDEPPTAPQSPDPGKSSGRENH